MTPPIDDPETLRRILAKTEALLLDFDGPICSVFAGIPAPVVADQLRGILAEGGHTDLPADVRSAADPFEVLFYAAKLGQNEARYVEAAFRAHEVEAVQSAQPTPGTIDLMHAWKATGRKLAIVSNNSGAAIRTYLDLHGTTELVETISARSPTNISILKPHPHLVKNAMVELNASPARCTLIGDSVTDVRAAASANVSAIAYANKPRKLELFAAANPIMIVTQMGTASHLVTQLS